MPIAYEDAERAVAARLGERALAHSKRVADAARDLAAAYGVDPEAARLAGILHDWDKDVPHDALLVRARELGIDVTQDEETVPHVLHARTGAADLEEAMPGLSDEILRAVEFHTVGCARMTDLDRVIYVADMIESGRDYPGVEGLRSAVGRVDLQELFARAFAQTIHSLLDRRRPIHSSTIETWNSIIRHDD